MRGLRRPDRPGAWSRWRWPAARCIAGYTVVDAHGLDHAAALPYLWIVMALTAVVLRAAGRAHPRPRGAARRVRWETVLAAVLFFGAYLLVLAALRLAEPGPVAAVRETSVVDRDRARLR